MSDVAILGELIGAAIAHRLAQRNRISGIRLIDAASAVAAGKALDIRQSGPVERFDTIVSAGSDPLEAAGAGVIVVADAAEGSSGSDHDRALVLVAQLLRAGTTAAFVFSEPSHAALMERVVRELTLPLDRAIGTASSAIVGTVRAMTAVEMNVSAVDVAGGATGICGRMVHRISRRSARYRPRAGAYAPVDFAGAAALLAASSICDRLGHRTDCRSVSCRKPTPARGNNRPRPRTRSTWRRRDAALELGHRRILSSRMPSLSPLEHNSFITSLS